MHFSMCLFHQHSMEWFSAAAAIMCIAYSTIELGLGAARATVIVPSLPAGPKMQIAGILSRSRGEYLAAASFFTNYHPIFSRSLGSSRAPHLVSPSPLQSTISNIFGPTSGCERAYHYGRPRGSLWRGKKEIGKEALFVILGMKRFKDDGEKLDKFIKTHVRMLLKLDMVAVLNELERQGEVSLAVKELGVLYSVNWA